MTNLADAVIATVDDTSRDFVSLVYNGLFWELSGIVISIITILMIIYGLFLMLGWIEYPVREFGKKIVLIVSVMALIRYWPFFDTFLYSTFTDGPDHLAAIILQSVGRGGPGQISTQLGDLVTESFWLAGQAFESDGWFMPYVLGLLILLAGFAFCVYALALIVIAKIGTALVLALGPVFIVFLLMSPTKHMFASWLQQLFSFAFMLILTYTTIVFFLQMYEGSINSIPDNGSIALGDIANLLVVSLIGFLVLGQVQGIASGLAGGAQLGTLGAFTAVGRRLGRVDWKSYSGPRFGGGSRSTSQSISRR